MGKFLIPHPTLFPFSIVYMNVMNQQITDHIIHFLARKESPEDVQELKEWLATNPAHRDELKQWLATWDIAGMMDISEKISSEDAYQRFIFRLNRETSSKADTTRSRTDALMRTIRRMAAAVVIGFALGIWFHGHLAKKQPEQVAFIESIVPLGSKSEIRLPDGSTVWLNAGSTIRYPINYGQTTRDIYLTGEGYFKVAKQADKPFTVHTALSKIRALGTEFNVKAYPDEDVVETTLIKGEVAIEKGEEGGAIDHTILLKPGQKLSVSAQTETVTKEPEKSQPDIQPVETVHPTDVQPVQPEPVIRQLSPSMANAEVSWKERNWRIESEPLQNLAVKIERRYDVTIWMDERLKSYRFTGTIKDESLEQVLYAMQLTAPIMFKIDGKNVFLHADPKKLR